MSDQEAGEHKRKRRRRRRRRGGGGDQAAPVEAAQASHVAHQPAGYADTIDDLRARVAKLLKVESVFFVVVKDRFAPMLVDIARMDGVTPDALCSAIVTQKMGASLSTYRERVAGGASGSSKNPEAAAEAAARRSGL